MRRLSADRHYCWSDCFDDGMEMLAAITAWAALIEEAGGSTEGVDVDGLVSASTTLEDPENAVEEEGSERYTQNIVALWEFKELEDPLFVSFVVP